MDDGAGSGLRPSRRKYGALSAGVRECRRGSVRVGHAESQVKHPFTVVGKPFRDRAAGTSVVDRCDQLHTCGFTVGPTGGQHDTSGPLLRDLEPIYHLETEDSRPPGYRRIEITHDDPDMAEECEHEPTSFLETSVTGRSTTGRARC